MSSYRKPTKLLPLNLYSPYLTYSNNRRLISRDQHKIFVRFHGDSDSFSKTQQPVLDTCVRSFYYMYRAPTCRNTSYHQAVSLGKERKTRLDPLAKTKAIQSESPKKYVARKPTITMRRSLTLQSMPTKLSEQILNGTLTLTSATLKTPENEIQIPLSHLKDIIFAPEGEVQYNISKCLESGKWELSSNLYSNFKELTSDYSAPYFLPSMQLGVFLLKSKGIYSKIIGKITQKLEEKGLVLKYYRMIEFNGPCILNAWEGCEAQGAIQKVLGSLPSDFYEITQWEDARKMLNKDSNVLISDLVPKYHFRVNENYVELVFPYFKYSEEDKVMCVPLGLLKELIDDNFSNWAEIWLKKNNESFPHRRSGLDNSSLKATLCIKDEPCLLTLSSYEILISNAELEISFAFKLSDMELLHTHSGSDLITHLMQSAQLQTKESRGKTIWDLIIDLTDLPLSKGEVPKESKVNINEKEFKCKFFEPSIELYKPHSGESSKIKLKPEEIQEVYKNQFKNWESLALKYIQ